MHVSGVCACVCTRMDARMYVCVCLETGGNDLVGPEMRLSDLKGPTRFS